MPTRIVSIPFVLLALGFLYLTWEVSEDYALWLPAPIVALAVVYVLGPQINWWWYQRNTPELEPPIRKLLEKHHFYYSRLREEDKKLFRQRVFLFRLGQDFMPKAWDSVPDDVKAVIAVHAVSLTLGWEKYLVFPYENVVVYPHPFPSLQFPKHFHQSELFEEDHVLLFNAEPLMKSLLRPKEGFNPALYEYARVLHRIYPEKPWPKVDDSLWQTLEAACGYSKVFVATSLNLPEEALEAGATLVVAFFIFPEAILKSLPAELEQLQLLFAFDPIEAKRL